MAEQEQAEAQAPHVEEEEVDTGYKAPAFKSMTEIVDQDKDDESLIKYKKALLGNNPDCNLIIDPSNPKQVILKEVLINIEGRDPLKMDLPDASDPKKKCKITLKEGSEYTVQINFGVQREIVSGLKYSQTVHRKGIKVDSSSYMMGSYAPNTELKYTTDPDSAPSGMLARGEYKVKSKFIDDDKNVHLEWEWYMEIKKEFD